MGSAPCPQCQTLPLFGMPEPNERRKLFGEPTPSPQYLRWHVFGSCPSPKVFMGSAPCPHVSRCRYSGCRTQRETQAIWGANPKPPVSPMACIKPPVSPMACIWELPKPPISQMVCIWENAQAPRCLWGVPHAPNVRRCRYSGCRTHSKTQAIWGANPSPQYLRWHVLGRCPSPRVYMGSAPCPQCQTLPLFGRIPEPL